LIVGAYTANPSDKPAAGKSYVVFGKADNSAIDLSVIADANNPLGGFIKSSKPSPLTSPALETDQPLRSPVASPLITKPPVELFTSAMVLRLMVAMSTAMAWMI
jgi:hypothetical protein